MRRIISSFPRIKAYIFLDVMYIPERLSLRNSSSYGAIVDHHENKKKKKEFVWRVSDLLDE